MKKERGFTLIELLVTMAIAAILATLAGPSFLRMIKANTMSGSVNTFLGDLRYARSEAIRRGGRVVMCRSDNPEATAPACATDAGTTGKGWATGWLIFSDRDGTNTWTTNDTTLRVQTKMTGMDSILESTATASTTFKFTATGRLQDGATTKLNFGGSQFDASQKRVVCVSPSGRARISDDGTCP